MGKNKRTTQASKKGEYSKKNSGQNKAARANCKYKTLQKPSNSKITSDRLTMPFGFFAQGVKSKTVQKNVKECYNQESYNFLNENLHALLRTVPDTTTIVKTSSQSKASPENLMVGQCFENVTDYYVELKSHRDDDNKENEPLLQNNSSLFKEINYLFQGKQAENTTTQDSDNLDVDAFSIGHLPIGSLPSRKSMCLAKIKSLVAEINTVLDGKKDVNCAKAVMRKTHKEPESVSYQLVPAPTWLYKTPDNRKLKRPSPAGSSINHGIFKKNSGFKVLFDLETQTADIFKRNNPSHVIPVVSPEIFPLLDVPLNIFSVTEKRLFENAHPKQGIFDSEILPGNFYRKKNSKRHKKNTFKYLENERNSIFTPYAQSNDKHFQFDTENFWTRHLGNHPTHTGFECEPNLIFDHCCLTPPIPILADATPFKFYPNQLFDKH